MWLVPQLWFGCVVLFSSAFIKAVDGFSKLPNGDGSNSLTGTVGTLRRYIHDWIETAPTTVQVCDAACQTKKKFFATKSFMSLARLRIGTYRLLLIWVMFFMALNRAIFKVLMRIFPNGRWVLLHTWIIVSTHSKK